MRPDHLGFPLQAGEWSYWFTTGLVVLFLTALALVVIWNRYNRPDLDSDHAATVLSQLRTFGGGASAVVFNSERDITDPDKLRDVRALFQRSAPASETTVTSATGEMLGKVRAELAERGPSVSKTPVRAAEEAVIVAVLGAIAMIPIAAWERAATGTPLTVPSVGDLSWAASLVGSWGVSAAFTFPYSEVLFAFALAFGILGATTVWTLWMVPPIVLAALAGTYWYLERKVDHDRDPSGPSILGWSRRLVTLGVITWAVGVVLVAVGSVIPGMVTRLAAAGVLAAALAGLYVYVSGVKPPHRTVRDANWKYAAFLAVIGLGIGHPALAFLAAAVVAARVILIWMDRTLYRWRLAAEHDGRAALGLDVIHSVTVTVGALVVPLIIAYGAVAIGTGKILAVAGVIASAPNHTALAVLALAVMVAIAVAVTFLDAFRDVRRGISRALSVQMVRTALIARAFPVLLVVVVGVLLITLGFPLIIALAVALGIGVFARLVYMAVNWVTFRTQIRPERERTASRVVVNGRQVRDDDGEPIYIAAANGHRVAHRDLDALIRQVQRDARSLFRTGDPEPSFCRYYYRHGVTRGRVDMDAVGDELLGDVRTRFKANVVQKDPDASEVMDKLLDEYPEPAVTRVLKDLKDRGRVTRREDKFQWLGE